MCAFITHTNYIRAIISVQADGMRAFCSPEIQHQKVEEVWKKIKFMKRQVAWNVFHAMPVSACKTRGVEETMKKAPRMKDIQNLIASYTANGITAHTYDFSSCNAHDIALILKIDRTNVSRVLNQLHRENRLIKLQGRPTLYLDAGVIH